MTGETNLDRLLKDMTPAMDDDTYVFCTDVERELIAANIPPLSRFEEEEGPAFIITKPEAERAGIPFTYPCRKITLHIHSSLEAVGFLARITDALAKRGISVNPFSAYYHDHLFVPTEKAAECMDVLHALSSGESS
ncbi:MAG: ACT domain-containing protein [Alphaproteobacteria bacterium]|nr:ACT domain-containing protein [Alphaproteobacteria bacterium]